MEAARLITLARRRAGLTQRELAARSGIKQPAIARIETRKVTPRADTIDRLLRACGEDLAPTRRLGLGVDRTMIRELLRLTPGERAKIAAEEARRLSKIVTK